MENKMIGPSKILEFSSLLDQCIDDYELGKQNLDRMSLLWWNFEYDDHRKVKSEWFNSYFTEASCSVCSNPLIFYLEKIELKDFMGTTTALCGLYRCIKCHQINWINKEEYKTQIIADPKFYEFAKNYRK